MILLKPFEPRFLDGIRVTPDQKHYQSMLDNPEVFTGAWCGFYDGELIVIGGGVVVGQEIAGWVLFTDNISPIKFIALHRVIERLIQEYEAQGFSVYIHVDPLYKKSDRWARLMGFTPGNDEQVCGLAMKRYIR